VIIEHCADGAEGRDADPSAGSIEGKLGDEANEERLPGEGVWASSKMSNVFSNTLHSNFSLFR